MTSVSLRSSVFHDTAKGLVFLPQVGLNKTHRCVTCLKYNHTDVALQVFTANEGLEKRHESVVGTVSSDICWLFSADKKRVNVQQGVVYCDAVLRADTKVQETERNHLQDGASYWLAVHLRLGRCRGRGLETSASPQRQAPSQTRHWEQEVSSPSRFLRLFKHKLLQRCKELTFTLAECNLDDVTSEAPGLHLIDDRRCAKKKRNIPLIAQCQL